MRKGKTVYVGLSGGVDSSVSALRLKKAGYNVVGVFIKVWQPDFLQCNWEEERLSAMQVAAQLDIPFLTFDAENAYRERVADYFVAEYRSGRTPNPDVMCNKYIKFGVFLDFATKHGADYVATGHYVRRQGHQMLRGVDTNKDQSYFLWALSSDDMERTLFPIGDSPKSTIRKEAKAAGLHTADKKDSQGICFLGQVDIANFLSHFVELKPGDVLDTSGRVIGSHVGALVYTLGQRHGFTVWNGNSTERLYVVERNLKSNTVTVDSKEPRLADSSQVLLGNCTWRSKIDDSEVYEVQFRYRQKPIRAKIVSASGRNATIELLDNTEMPAAGQSAVVYDREWCLGGGIIEACQSL
tara:strand:- start:4871 stop:5932 length:1062 start_codon:yes stop_codon:yes gene_type:complete